MGSPPKHRSLQKGIEILWRLLYQNLPVVFCHMSLQKVAVRLMVGPETGLENAISE